VYALTYSTGQLTTLGQLPGAPAQLLVGNDGYIYTVITGSAPAYGWIYKLPQTGGTPILVHAFAGTDGAQPSSLIQGDDGNFFGTTLGQPGAGATDAFGEVFGMTSGGQVTILHSFNGTDGQTALSLIQGSDRQFYGVTYNGGPNGSGEVFKLTYGNSIAPLPPWTYWLLGLLICPVVADRLRYKKRLTRSRAASYFDVQ